MDKLDYATYQRLLAPGTSLGSFSVQKVTPDVTVLLGDPQIRRGATSGTVAAPRYLPTPLLLEICNAILTGSLPFEVLKDNRKEKGLSQALLDLGIAHDTYILGYDSNILRIHEFVVSKLGSYRPSLRPSAPLPKPFLLLAGISGTGKTRWVRQRAVPGKNNVKVIPVRPDWHEPTDLLGYVSRISTPEKYVSPTGLPAFLIEAWRDCWAASPTLTPAAAAVDAMTPFWLCLDEMNLAPVEQYFADYLSVLEERHWTGGVYSCPPLLKFESPEVATLIREALMIPLDDSLWSQFLNADEPGIPLPPNLVVVGTVNMDETTHGFSRKVLDRALTIEFDDVDFGLYGGTQLADELTTVLPWTSLGHLTDVNDFPAPPSAKAEVLDFLEHWNLKNAQTPFRIAYRTINESLLIAGSLEGKPAGEVLDWVAMTKLLPRLEGDADKCAVLDTLLADWPAKFGESWKDSRSQRKLLAMQERLKRTSYTSFWP
ncbi:MAG: hypothetical protein WCG80_10560 [Spirochaetales bacterium]